LQESLETVGKLLEIHDLPSWIGQA